ncbi:uncharacterized protein LOC132279848 [Cornus florida]|uniref:uncharacterized protein LOC132279848 n=1 Tax=Cornus florida TaxID=4283 RepID=UPI002898F6F3|nr:uncharacterized protein LOC132279848 [Cornus florida]
MIKQLLPQAKEGNGGAGSYEGLGVVNTCWFYIIRQLNGATTGIDMGDFNHFGLFPFNPIKDARSLFYTLGEQRRLIEWGKYKDDKIYTPPRQYRTNYPVFMTIDEYMEWLSTATSDNEKDRIYGYVKSHRIYVVERSKPEKLLKSPVKDSSWKAPPLGCVKINVDGAFRKVQVQGKDDEGKGAWGAVYRDHEGNVLLVLCDAIDNATTAYQCEVRAFLEGLKGAHKFGYKSIFIESDCQNLIAVLDKEIDDKSEFAEIYSEIKTEYEGFDFKDKWHIFREANTLAHRVAQGRINGVILNQDVIKYLAKQDVSFRFAPVIAKPN